MNIFNSFKIIKEKIYVKYIKNKEGVEVYLILALIAAALFASRFPSQTDEAYSKY